MLLSWLSTLKRSGRQRKTVRSSHSRRPYLPRIEELEGRITPADFSVAGPTNFTNVANGDAVWGDYDADGFLDALVVGQSGTFNNANRRALVYKGDGTATFTLTATLPVGVENGGGAWGDIDNDGDLDLALVGDDSTGGVTLAVFRNDGSNTFTNVNAAALVGVSSASLAWGDYNNDGRLDLVVAGTASGVGRITTLYRNDGGGAFTAVTGTGLTGVSSSAVAWGDFNGDGYLDLALSGDSADEVDSTYVYRNESGSGVFTEVATPAGAREGSVAWGDYDNDGDLDLLTSGYTSGTTGAATKLYQNDAGVFTAIAATNLIGVGRGAAVWGDYNNDGILDVTVIGAAGYDDTSKTVRFYSGVGDGTFTQTQSFVGLTRASAAWGDFDNDGKLDGLYTGKDGSNATALLRNTSSAAANTPPAAPTGLTATIVSSTSVTLSWTAPTDAEQSASGLSYAIRVGTTPGGSDVVNPMANASTGFRSLPRIGFVQSTGGWTLTGLDPTTTYYWSVQAIDGGLAGSEFAAEGSFIIDPTTTATGAVIAVGSGPGGDTVRLVAAGGALQPGFAPYGAGMVAGISVARGDVNGDGVIDLITVPRAGAAAHVKVFSGASGAELYSFYAYAGYTGGVHVAAGDVDHDGFADIITGSATSSSHVKVFSGATGAEIRSFLAYGPGYNGGVNVGAGDIDGDGFADILTGSAGSSSHVKAFSGATQAELASFFAYSGHEGGVSVAGGDVNGDGRADIITGSSRASSHVRAFRATDLAELMSFFALDPTFNGGVAVG